MLPSTMLIVAGVLALVATVLAFIYIVPEERREKMGSFGKFLHDTCNFKYLMVEKILQALYIFSTAAVILFGVLMLFRTEYNYWTDSRIWMGGYGLLIIILGPIAIRLSYELMMMAILLLKNVIAINRKLPDKPGSAGGDVFAVPDMQELRQRREAAPHSAGDRAPAFVLPRLRHRAGQRRLPQVPAPVLQALRHAAGQRHLPQVQRPHRQHAAPGVKPDNKSTLRPPGIRVLFFITRCPA